VGVPDAEMGLLVAEFEGVPDAEMGLFVGE
jgi:hypothetical protein